MEAEAWMIVGGTVFGVGIVLEFLKEWAKRKLFANGNHKFCDEHHTLKDTLDAVLENQKEEKQEEMLTRALAKALKKNGKQT